jgi:hypothetical protein
MLESVTLSRFWYLNGTFNITASIYAVPGSMKDGDVLTTPLWTSTVSKSYSSSSSGISADSIFFSGPKVFLPNQVVLGFSFTAVSGTAAIPLQRYGSDNKPLVGTVATNAYYYGYTRSSTSHLNAGWFNLVPPDNAVMYAPGKITASVPDPSAIIPLSFGLMGFIFSKRRVRHRHQGEC